MTALAEKTSNFRRIITSPPPRFPAPGPAIRGRLEPDSRPNAKSVYGKNRQDAAILFNHLPPGLKEIANQRVCADGIGFLQQFPDGSVPMAFFDPQYRGVLDRMNYGNEGERQIKRAQLTQMTEATIHQFIGEYARVLAPSGHLMLWIDKFHLVEGVNPWYAHTDLLAVDLITWDKGRIGMGYRTRRKSEYLLILQKPPKRAKGVWCVHTIADVVSETHERGGHAHSKPIELQAKLIEAVTEEGDFVLDAAAGGFSVLAAAKSVNRHFIGCDIMSQVS
ncbi:MAG: DNA methyltransferase [Candidatus Symbiobacter sp.]|nr:DNA methyltransferase [Candidatus Symbiobacter sp.]